MVRHSWRSESLILESIQNYLDFQVLGECELSIHILNIYFYSLYFNPNRLLGLAWFLFFLEGWILFDL